jgi:PAS domain S-box-containing protein
MAGGSRPSPAHRAAALSRAESVLPMVPLDGGETMEQRLRRYGQFHGLVVQLLQCTMETEDTTALLERFLALAMQISWPAKASQGLIFLRQEDQRFTLEASHNLSAADRQRYGRMADDFGLCGRVVQEGRPVFESTEPARALRMESGGPVLARYCIPIAHGGDPPLGVLCLFFDSMACHDQEVEALLMSCADIIAGFCRRIRSEQRLASRTELLSSIFSALDSIGLIVVTLEESDARICRLNPGAENLFGYGRHELLGQSITRIHPPEGQADIAERVALLRCGKSFRSLLLRLQRKSGECFTAVVSIHPLTCNRSRQARAVAVFRDVTELVAVQEELALRVQERTTELQLMQRQFLHAEKLSAIGKLSSSIAHEFNNPLQSVLSILKGVSKRAQLEEEDVPLMEAAIGECYRMKNLLRSLQDFHRPSAGQRVVMDFHASLDSVLLLFRSDFRKRHIKVLQDRAAFLPHIIAIPDQIKQVLLNLLDNAMDACVDGGEISIRTWQEPTMIGFAIGDNGGGIEADRLAQIFEPFYTTKPEVKGTGLGLSVSHGIIEGHKGSIRVESEVGQGSCFTVRLPKDARPEPGGVSEPGPGRCQGEEL